MRVRFILLLLLFFLSFALRVFHLSAVPQTLLEKELKSGVAADFLSRNPADIPKALHDKNIGIVDLTDIAPLSLVATLPSVATIGLSAFSVRLPSALLGALAVPLIYLVTRELLLLLQKRSQNQTQLLSQHFVFLFSLLSALYLAISPWHIQISRVDVGVNLGLVFFLLGIFLALKLPRSPKLVLFLPILFAFSILSEYLFLIPSVIAFSISLILLRSSIRGYLFRGIIGMSISLFLIAPFFHPMLQTVTQVDEPTRYALVENETLAQQRIDYSGKTPLSYILFTPYFEDFKLYVKRLTQYTEPQKLFSEWDNNAELFSPLSGLFYPLDVVFILAGLIFLLKNNRLLFFLYTLFCLITLLQRALTHTTDPLPVSVLLMPSILLLLYGAFGLFEKLHSKKQLAIICIVLISLYCVIRFLLVYFIVFPSTSTDNQNEYKQALLYRISTFPDKQQTQVTDTTYGHDVYLTLLFLKGLQQQREIKKAEEQRYGAYSFTSKLPIGYKKNIIYIQPTDSVPKHQKVLFTSSSPQKAFRISVFSL